MSYGVWNDFGKLREVAVGTAEGIVIPDDNNTYPPGARALIQKYAGQAMGNIPELVDMIRETQEQLDNLARVYAEHDVIVHRPRPHTKAEYAYDAQYQRGAHQMFPADPIWMIGRFAVECRFRSPFRNKGVFPMRDLITPTIRANPEIRVISCPPTRPVFLEGPDATKDTDNYYLEGGDILICGNEGKDILVGVDEARSSSVRGVEWLGSMLSQDGWKVTPVPITQDAPIHLLGAMGACGPEMAVMYLPSFKNGIPYPIRDWDIIECTEEEVRAGGPCLVMLDPKTAIVTAETPRLIGELENRGIKVIPVPFDKLTRFDGAVRCATFIMHRERE